MSLGLQCIVSGMSSSRSRGKVKSSKDGSSSAEDEERERPAGTEPPAIEDSPLLAQVGMAGMLQEMMAQLKESMAQQKKTSERLEQLEQQQQESAARKTEDAGRASSRKKGAGATSSSSEDKEDGDGGSETDDGELTDDAIVIPKEEGKEEVKEVTRIKTKSLVPDGVLANKDRKQVLFEDNKPITIITRTAQPMNITPYHNEPDEDPLGWINKFEDACEAQALDDKQKGGTMGTAMIGNAQKWWLALEARVRRNGTLAMKEFRKQFVPEDHNRVTTARRNLVLRRQQDTETVSQYIIELKDLAKKARVKLRVRDETIKESFIDGLRDDVGKQLRRRDRTKITLDKAVEEATRTERDLRSKGKVIGKVRRGEWWQQ